MFSFRIIPLGERILFDAAALLDIMAFGDTDTDAESDSGLPNSPIVMNAEPAMDSDGVRLLVVASEVNDAENLSHTVIDGVQTLTYTAATTAPLALASQIASCLKGKKADSIVITSIPKNEDFYLSGDKVIKHDNPLADTELEEFWRQIGDNITENGRIDLVVCKNTAGPAKELEIIATVEHLYKEATSGKKEQTTGDEVLEGRKVAKLYFDPEKLAAWNKSSYYSLYKKGELPATEDTAEKSTVYALGVIALNNFTESPISDAPTDDNTDPVNTYLDLIKKAFDGNL